MKSWRTKPSEDGPKIENTPPIVLTAYNSWAAQRKLKISPIWRAKVEPKYRFFVRTLMHSKILTFDNLQKKDVQITLRAVQAM